MKVYKFTYKNCTTLINLHQVCTIDFFDEKVVITFCNGQEEILEFSEKELSQHMCESLFKYWSED